ncbi:hypothetical protein FHR81_003200 [Actinoalloteichus hoggarensis]|uniref:Uncharacterized protein n=1 Tax=Actinoalloteichus hoggarensis TaxID=1470176 RepID=A0A221W891_9PSEU|nr:hypothetical protein [Actinoalloteichus hoggarensis]ASO21557.1 hypothetical protein AHOG_19695 [Actinoalloteichus hoggarensis]MBB5922148.1 hypothetical protein [Actinoalloteichus hoggarensis]
MPRPSPITDTERDRVAAPHAAGRARAAIARALGRSPSTVGKIASAARLSWDRTATASAIAAKQIDNMARRATIVGRLYDQAAAQLDRLNRSTHGLAIPSAGALAEWTARDLPARDVRALLSAVFDFDPNRYVTAALPHTVRWLTGDIAAVSARQLFDEAPTIRVTDRATQDRLDTILTEGAVIRRLAEAGSISARLGGVYLKLAWDADLARRPIGASYTRTPLFQSGDTGCSHSPSGQRARPPPSP